MKFWRVGWVVVVVGGMEGGFSGVVVEVGVAALSVVEVDVEVEVEGESLIAMLYYEVDGQREWKD